MELTPCIEGEPLSKFDEDGKAAVLNYNLPQATAYDIVTYIKLEIPEKLFKSSALKPPAGNYWDRFAAQKDKLDLTPQRIGQVINGQAYSELTEVMNTALNYNASEVATATGVKFKAANLTVSTQSANFANEYTANKIAEGYRPVLVPRPSGKQSLVFQPRPKKASPAIYMVMRMKMATYPGDYGAGTTISTFTLLPGEQTVIQIRDYRHNEATKTTSESVLDSYSEHAMEDLQTTIESSTAFSFEASETDTDTMAASTGGEVGVNLGIVKIGGEAGAEASSVNTTTEAVSQQINTLNNAVSHHTQTADTQRQVEVSTDVTETEISETEKTVTRTLENVNKSCVLNFVVRQLLQRFDTITYLDNVTFAYSNGFDNSRKTGTLSSLDNLLRSVLKDANAVKKVQNDIYMHLCNIPDHTGTRLSFVEEVVEEHGNCINKDQRPKKVRYVRKRQDLVQEVNGKRIHGVVLNVTERVMRTPAVIMDAVKGQGFALDCYNQKLQEAAWMGAHLANRKTAQALEIIDAITDPLEKAKFYNNVFGTCCGTPQATAEE
jgi:hypothetical protein